MKDKLTEQIVKELGGVSRIASFLGISKAAVSKWKTIPVNRCKSLEQLSKGRVKRAKMRPDIFK